MKKQLRTATPPLSRLLFASFIFSSLYASGASARDVTQLEMLRCTSIQSQSEKLACFESLIEAIPMVATKVDDTEGEEDGKSQDAKPKKGAWTDRFGLGVLKKKPKKVNFEENQETYHATVTKVQEGNYRVLYFYTEEGHVWRQIEAERISYPKKQSFKITVVQNRLGVYQLKVKDGGKFTSVKRLK